MTVANFLDPRLPDHFWSSAMPCPISGCWLWLGTITGAGYGHRRIGGQDKLMHRLAYEALIGPIPSGLQIDHKCRVRCCVNPTHMEPVTNRVNILRGVGITAEAARKDRCSNGHPFDEENTRLVKRGEFQWRRCRACQLDWYHRNKKPRRVA